MCCFLLFGVVVFNFKVLFIFMIEFRDELYILLLVFKVFEEGKESLFKYKGMWYVEYVVKLVLWEYVWF